MHAPSLENADHLSVFFQPTPVAFFNRPRCLFQPTPVAISTDPGGYFNRPRWPISPLSSSHLLRWVSDDACDQIVAEGALVSVHGRSALLPQREEPGSTVSSASRFPSGPCFCPLEEEGVAWF